jgi:hypothetical protein
MVEVQPPPICENAVTSRRTFLRQVTTVATAVTFAAIADAASAEKPPSQLPTSGLNNPKIEIINDPGYDATADIQAARTRHGWAGDVAALENACNNRSRRVVLRPEVGGLLWDRRMILIRPNQQLAFLGGMQAIPIVAKDTLADGAISVGRPSDNAAPAGGFIAENLWFVQPGRLGYSTGPLRNMLTGGQAFIEICRGQAFKLSSCGGYGMPHAIKLVGCGGGVIENGFHFGGVYNPNLPAAQESISQIYLADGTPYGLGHNVNITVRDIEAYGGNTMEAQLRTIGGKSVKAGLRCGPRFGILAESVECLTINGGFFAGYAEACVVSKPSSPACVLQRIVLNGTFLDESNSALIKTFRENDSYPQLDTLIINGCDMNGQIVTENGLWTQLSPGGLPSVRRVLRVASPVRAVLGSGARMEGYDQYDETTSNAYGYNLADNDDTAGAGIYTSAVYLGPSGGIATITNEQFGGGMNGLDDEVNTVIPGSGLTLNGCLWGIYSANRNTAQALTRTRNLAKAGGGRLGGTVSTLPL